MVAEQIGDFTDSRGHPILSATPKRRARSMKKVLIVHAHPEPTSLTRQLVEVSSQTLQRCGHEVLQSDLYGMRWKAVFDEQDFPTRANPDRLSFIEESGNSYLGGRQTADVTAEQQKVFT